MRISSDKADPGYPSFARAQARRQTVRIFLDGVEQAKCLMADTELGLVERPVLGPDGKIQIDPNDPESIWIERVEGDVRVEFV